MCFYTQQPPPSASLSSSEDSQDAKNYYHVFNKYLLHQNHLHVEQRYTVYNVLKNCIHYNNIYVNFADVILKNKQKIKPPMLAGQCHSVLLLEKIRCETMLYVMRNHDVRGIKPRVKCSQHKIHCREIFQKRFHHNKNLPFRAFY